MGKAGFPVAIAKRDLAAMTARPIGQAQEYRFGLDRDACAASLRLLADDVQSGAVLPQEITDASVAAIDDYAMRVLTLKYVTKEVPNG